MRAFWLLAFLGLALASARGEQSVTLAWDSNPESDIGGYIVYYGCASRNYTNAVNVGNVTTNTVRGLVDGATYFFAVTAYNTNGLESDFSDEVSYSSAGGNLPPLVSAGPDVNVTWPGVARLYGTATDDGNPNPPAVMATTWSKVSGPGIVTFANASSTNTTATFSAVGTYVLRLTASDAQLSGSDTLTVVVSPAPRPSPARGLRQAGYLEHGEVLDWLACRSLPLVAGPRGPERHPGLGPFDGPRSHRDHRLLGQRQPQLPLPHERRGLLHRDRPRLGSREDVLLCRHRDQQRRPGERLFQRGQYLHS